MEPYFQVTAFIWILWWAIWIVMSFGTKRTVSYARSRGSRLAGHVGLIALIWFVYNHPGVGWLGSPILPQDALFGTLGIAVCAFGIVFAVWARFVLAGNWSSRVTLKEDHELVERGPYAIVRHPIYTGVITGLLGTLLASGDLFMLVILTILTIGIVFKLRDEEKLMMKTFPDEYPEYRKRVKAIVPGVV